jgi:LCP family protein required for cell wall assembly
MLGAAVAIVLLTIVAASTAAIEAVGTIADLFPKAAEVHSPYLKPVGADAPTTFLLLGSDQRDRGAKDASGPPHSDTILLVHLDPGTGQWSELSIPRDYYVHFTWDGSPYASKINFAFTVGGIKASLKVVAGLLHIPINYVVDIDFTAFDDIVDKLGCVYVDVDHLYENTPAESQYDDYAAIYVRPGYQKLCGERALDYVRYRHDDTTFARDAREQAFLRDAKEQLGLSGLLDHANDIIKALRKSITSNITGSQVAGLLETLISSVSGSVNQVQFPDEPLNVDGQDDQTATPRQIASVVRQFLEPSVAPPALHAIVQAAHATARHASGGGGGGGGGRGSTPAAPPSVPNLTATQASETSQAAELSPYVPFPIYMPTLMLGSASLDGFESFSHYAVRDPQGVVRFGYRVDWASGLATGSYYGIEGMNWTDPPLFAHADTIAIRGRSYLYVNTGGKVQDVGWIVGGNLYWVSNTIFQDLSAAQMFAIAASARPAA